MSNHFPIPSPPPELVEKWEEQFMKRPTINGCFIQSYIATKAAQWGADQELEACCEWTTVWISAPEASQLFAARRPKSPSLKEQALAALDVIEDKWLGPTVEEILIRKALEQLND